MPQRHPAESVAIFRVSAIRAIEAAAQASNPQPSLMQRAGAAAAAWVCELIGERPDPVLLLIGPGNNGGDALVCATALRRRGYACCCVGLPVSDKTPADALAAYQAFTAAGGELLHDIPTQTRFSLIVDGLFGIGLNQSLTVPYAGWVATANNLSARDAVPLLALDIASGLNADSGQAFSACINATHTLTFIALKSGLLTGDGPQHSGLVKVCDLGIAPSLQTPVDGLSNTPSGWADALPRRHLNAHKGDAGSVGLIGGASSMRGALLLAARAALHCGAGRIYAASLGADELALDPVHPEIMWRDLATLRNAPLTVLGIGPGLGRDATARDTLASTLDFAGPLVLDADALVLLPEFQTRVAQRSAPTVLTPHPGETAMLLACTVADIAADRIKAAQRIAAQYRAYVVLKGCGSVIATPDGNWWLNPTGNPGMASGGMGDVLTGIICALLAQGMPPIKALGAAVWLHGAAADACVTANGGPLGLTASELIPTTRRLLNTFLKATP